MLKIGDPAPDFELSDETGKKVSLSGLSGQSVVLVFYPLDFSPICTKELHEITSHQERYQQAHAQVFGISVDIKYTHAAFKKSESLSATLLADFHPKGKVAQLYGVYLDEAGIAKRGTFVIDKDGIIRGITINGPGEARNQAAYFEQLSVCKI